MGHINLTPQRESRLKLALPPHKQEMAKQIIAALNATPIGVHVTFSQLIELSANYGSVGDAISYLAKHKEFYSLSGIAQLFEAQQLALSDVQQAYQIARVRMENYNRQFKNTSIQSIIESIEKTPISWEFEGYAQNQMTWATADSVVLNNKNLGKYIARLELPRWNWVIFSKKYSEDGGAQHPHVDSSGYPCYGNAAGMMVVEKGIVKNLEGLWAFLHNYNVNSAYRKLETF